MQQPEVVFSLGVDDATAVRFSVSAAHELMRAVGVLQDPGRYPLQWAWLREVRNLVPRDAFDVVSTVIRPGRYVPDFLTPVSEEVLAGQGEFEAVFRAPVAAVLQDLRKCAIRAVGAHRARINSWIENPEGALEEIGTAWQALWQVLIRPHWTQVRQVLDTDIEFRARTQARVGLGAMMETLHDRVSWAPGEVHVAMDAWNERVSCTGSGLLLVPSVFSWPRCSVITQRQRPPILFYPARMISEAWPTARRERTTALGPLFGNGRALVLAGLESPRSTSDLAKACSLTAATASYHVKVLRDAGLVSSERAGKSMMHQLTDLGRTLLRGS